MIDMVVPRYPGLDGAFCLLQVVNQGLTCDFAYLGLRPGVTSAVLSYQSMPGFCILALVLPPHDFHLKGREGSASHFLDKNVTGVLLHACHADKGKSR